MYQNLTNSINDDSKSLELVQSKKKLVDVFMMCNELDMLELRLSEHNREVDYFIIIEARKTFTGKDKPLNFLINKDRYKKWESKIIYLIIQDFTNVNVQSAWNVEYYCRNFAESKLREICDKDTLILCSDLDEIINPDILMSCKLSEMNESRSLETLVYYYNANWKTNERWCHPTITKYSVLVNKYNSSLQNLRSSWNTMKSISNAGWHLSYFFSYELIQYKIKAFSHTEFDSKEYTSLKNIEQSIKEGRDLFKRKGFIISPANNNDTLPENIRILPNMYQRKERIIFYKGKRLISFPESSVVEKILRLSFQNQNSENPILQGCPVRFSLTNTSKVRVLLSALEIVLKNNIPGDIVELGCETSELSIYIRLMLDYYGESDKREYHVYDSWEDVPAPDINDPFSKECCSSKMSKFIIKFEEENLRPPIIHTSWFAQINERSYPEQISFVYFDGNLHQSIINSFDKIFHKITKGGYIVIDDYEYPHLPDCKKVIEYFLKDQEEEEMIINKYSDIRKGVLIEKGKHFIVPTKIHDYEIFYGTIDTYQDVTNKMNDDCKNFNTFNGHFTDHLPGISKNLSFHILYDNNKFTFEITETGMIRSNIIPKILLNRIRLLYGAANYYSDVTHILFDIKPGYHSFDNLFESLSHVNDSQLNLNTLKIILSETSNNKSTFEITNNGLIRNITESLKKKELLEIKEKVIAFHPHHFSERGTSVAVYDYAHYNETLLNNKSIIIYQNNHPFTHPLVKKNFESRFKCIGYNNPKEIENIIDEEQINVFYNIVGERVQLPVFDCLNVTHSVFKNIPLHGDIHIAISEEVSKTLKVVPHIVSSNLDEINPKRDNLREELRIPFDAIVIGRHGGKNSFDIQYVKETIINLVLNYENIWFLFLNTNIFYNHPRIIHIDTVVSLYEKNKFILTCDAMIHASILGETFGLAIAEFSVCNKPIITTNIISDIGSRMHLKILNHLALIYYDVDSLTNYIIKIKFIIESKKDIPNYWNAYEQYSPEKVMKIFNDVILCS